MKLAAPAVLLLVALLGCGGGGGTTTPPVVQGNPPVFAGNYAISLTSQVNPQNTFQLGGSMASDAAGHFTGAMHILNLSPCIAAGTPITMSGTVDGNGLLTFTSAAIANQIFTGTATISSTGVSLNSGTYSVAGGCAGGDHGSLSGGVVPAVTGPYNVTFAITTPSNLTLTFTAPLTQSGPDAGGVFHIAGTISNSGQTNCPIATIQTSQLMGNQISFSAPTINDPANTTVNFTGNANVSSKPNVAQMSGQVSTVVGNPANAGANPCGGMSGSAAFAPQ